LNGDRPGDVQVIGGQGTWKAYKDGRDRPKNYFLVRLESNVEISMGLIKIEMKYFPDI